MKSGTYDRLKWPRRARLAPLQTADVIIRADQPPADEFLTSTHPYV